MKRLFAILALVGAFGLATPAWSEDAAPAASTSVTTTAAPAAAATAAPAAVAAPAAAAAAPVVDTVNKGDNAWLMVCSAFVILMSVPGIALFYGGLVRSKNMLSILIQVLVVFSLATILWVTYGYSLAFTEGNAFFGTLSKAFLKGITD